MTKPNNYVRIFDTTLRDGEQSPGATLTSPEKLEIARGLARLGVDIIEAGFPVASPDDFQGVYRIAQEVGNTPRGGEAGESPPPIICGLARATEADIDAAWEAVQPAASPRIHTFLATSPIHMEHKLGMSPEEVLARVAKMVAYAHALCADVEFSPEDAGRSQPAFLYRVLEAAIRAGATTLNIPDTVGYTTPDEFRDLIAGIMANVPGIEEVTVSVHCHNDLGLATANTLAGIMAGARQAEVTVNGLGERAGNTALEEVVMALHTRHPVYALETGIDTKQITRISHMISNYTGMPVQPNKAIVGANAFAHEAGIHQDGMLKNNNTYEIMLPATVGLSRSRLVLGKHSGRHALKTRLEELGFDLGEDELAEAFQRFKQVADKKKTITDADLEVLVEDQMYQAKQIYSLAGLQVACGTMGLPTATVRLHGPEGETYVQASVGTGPVDAAYKAIDDVLQVPNTLLEFSVNAVTEGIDAIGEVTVRLKPENGSIPRRTSPQSGRSHARSFGGYGADTDIIVASAKAYLSGLNKLIAAREYLEQEAEIVV
ncbi:MAG: 2-isopropylmalate synthase [Chloroflexi bacterium]|nr:2-isopropylmalate synthase [Chloroflexota bacterium]